MARLGGTSPFQTHKGPVRPFKVLCKRVAKSLGDPLTRTSEARLWQRDQAANAIESLPIIILAIRSYEVGFVGFIDRFEGPRHSTLSNRNAFNTCRSSIATSAMRVEPT